MRSGKMVPSWVKCIRRKIHSVGDRKRTTRGRALTRKPTWLRCSAKTRHQMHRSPLSIVSLHSKPPTTTPPILSASRKFSANCINAAAPAVTAVTAVTAGHLCSWLQAVSCRHFHSRHLTGGRGFPKEGKSYLRRWNVAPFLRECCLRPPLSSPDSPPPLQLQRAGAFVNSVCEYLVTLSDSGHTAVEAL